MRSAVIVSLRVPAAPEEAFRAFTEEIGDWWRESLLFPLTPRGDGALRFEPGEGGRLVTELANGKLFEIGKIKVWAPGVALVLSWRQASFARNEETEVEIRFEAVGDETRIIVEHRGWDLIPREHVARHGFPLMVFQQRKAEHWRAALLSMSARLRR